MRLDAFALMNDPPPLVPGRPERAWMDASGSRAAYRCLPLTIANTSGWELLCPHGVTAEWNGGGAPGDLNVVSDEPGKQQFASSHFGQGVITFSPGYLFRTDEGWATILGGPPNMPKHGVQALTGLVESDWLPFPATMNWIMTSPGIVRFEAGEPFGFVSVVENSALDRIAPTIRSLESDPDLRAQYVAWSKSRAEFNAGLNAGDPETLKAAWQRFYLTGKTPEGVEDAPAHHMLRRRLETPSA